MPKAAVDWSDDRIELLRKCHDDGMSAAQTAACMGHITRNAVLGKIYRLGLSGPVRIAVTKAPPKPRVYSPRRRSPTLPREPETTVAFAGSLNMPFAGLSHFKQYESNQCRYIEGDGPDYPTCGAATEVGASWCTHHQQIVWAAPALRRGLERRDNKAISAFNARHAAVVA